MAVDGNAADLVLQSESGVVAESENPNAVADSAEGLASMSAEQLLAMGERAQRYYHEHLALSVGVTRFGVIFKQLTAKAHSK
jgi:hypothetical protein